VRSVAFIYRIHQSKNNEFVILPIEYEDSRYPGINIIDETKTISTPEQFNFPILENLIIFENNKQKEVVLIQIAFDSYFNKIEKDISRETFNGWILAAQWDNTILSGENYINGQRYMSFDLTKKRNKKSKLNSATPALDCKQFSFNYLFTEYYYDPTCNCRKPIVSNIPLSAPICVEVDTNFNVNWSPIYANPNQSSSIVQIFNPMNWGLVPNPSTAGGYTEPSAFFVLSSEIQANYPRFTNLVKGLSTYVKNQPSVLKALELYTGFYQYQIFEKLRFGYSPTIIVKDIPNTSWGDRRYGYFDNNENPNVLNINKSVVLGLEQSNLESTKLATSFFLAVTVLHEFVHYSRFNNGLSEVISGVEYEFGFGFELQAFGVIVELTNAYKYSLQFYKKN
jgi:hypothetical protein